MKRLLLFLSCILLFSGLSQGQDIPLFSQKLTNSFLYNPAMAGQSFGSLTLAHRVNYSGVAGAPVDNYISFQTPFAYNRFGFGVNAYQEKVNVLDNTYVSGAFAYHLRFGQFNALSMGVGMEYNMQRLNSTLTENISNDVVLQRYNTGVNQADFSFGMVYQSRLYKAGLAANRLSTALFQQKGDKVLSNYYTAFFQGTVPVRNGEDLFEPYIMYRKFSQSNQTIDIGAYYTFANKLIGGLAVRNGSVYSATVGYKITDKLLIGYSREMILGSSSGFAGSSQEFTLRLDFSQKEVPGHFNRDYKSSLSYRRKTLNTSGVKKTTGGRTPSQLSKAQKRVAAYTPNKRYQNNSRLSKGKKTSSKKSPYTSSNKKRKKPPRKK